MPSEDTMTIISVEKNEKVAVLSMNNSENRQNPTFAKMFLQTLDDILKDENITSLIVTSSDEKYFSLGVDVQWLMKSFEEKRYADIKEFLYLMNKVFRTLLLYPMPVIAAINGHAFGNGALLSCACDFRFMKEDKGFFCFPEVDIDIPFLPGMIAWAKKAIPQYKFQEMLYSGNKYDAKELMAHNVITKSSLDDKQLLKDAMEFAKTFEKKRPIFGELKRRNHKEIIRVIDEEDQEFIESLKLLYT